MSTLLVKKNDYLVLHLKEMAWHRAIIRSIEAKFFSKIPLEKPVLDVGCGDGHFASVVFAEPLDAGIDVSQSILNQAQTTNMYRELKISCDNLIPFPDNHFSSVISNCVIEHIPDQKKTLREIARVLKPGGLFVFSTPSELFEQYLWIPKLLDKVGLKKQATGYRNWFTKISKHFHYRSLVDWEDLLKTYDFKIEWWKYYMSPRAMKAFELSHYYGSFFLLTKKLFNRWILVPQLIDRLNIDRWFRTFYEEEVSQGAYLFFVCRKKT